MRLSKIMLVLAISTIPLTSFTKTKDVKIGRKIAQEDLSACYSFQAMEGQNVVVFTEANSPFIQIYFGDFFDFLKCDSSKTQLKCAHTSNVLDSKGENKLDKKRNPILVSAGLMTFNWGAGPTLSTKGLNNITHKYAEFDRTSRKYLAKLNDLDNVVLTKLEACPELPNANQ